jgi:hypothetical protein
MSLTILGADYAWSKPDSAGLKKDGVKFVMRYLSHDPSKNLTIPEFRELANAGFGVGLVWETTANRALSGTAAGVADATWARNQVRDLGLNFADGGFVLPIYFAVDFNATDAQKPTIASYLAGAVSVLGKNRVGVYGGYHVVKYCVDHDVCRWFWQTYAWSARLVHPKAHIYQYRNGISKHGGQYDLNKARDDVPFGTTLIGAKHKKAPLKQRLQWRSNVKVLGRIISNHPHWPKPDLDVLRKVKGKYEQAIKRGWV